jgi:hypothetical protein
MVAGSLAQLWGAALFVILLLGVIMGIYALVRIK